MTNISLNINGKTIYIIIIITTIIIVILLLLSLLLLLLLLLLLYLLLVICLLSLSLLFTNNSNSSNLPTYYHYKCLVSGVFIYFFPLCRCILHWLLRKLLGVLCFCHKSISPSFRLAICELTFDFSRFKKIFKEVFERNSKIAIHDEVPIGEYCCKCLWKSPKRETISSRNDKMTKSYFLKDVTAVEEEPIDIQPNILIYVSQQMFQFNT